MAKKKAPIRKKTPVRKKRQTRSRKQRRSLLRWENVWPVLRPITMIVLVVSIGFAGWRGYEWFSRPSTFPIQYVQITGDVKQVDLDDLKGRIDEYVSGGFFNIDLDQILNELKAVSWVYDVSLRRMWPNRLLVRIEEQQPIAHWGAGKMLNRYGEVFSAKTTHLIPVLPVISGQLGREKDLILFFNQADRLLLPLGLKLVALREDARGDQRLMLDNGIELALGRKDRMQRMQRFVSAYEKTLEPFMKKIAVLDLRYANGFAVRWISRPESVKKANFEGV